MSTNIAETSLTVDGILYVIDTGYVKMKVRVRTCTGRVVVGGGGSLCAIDLGYKMMNAGRARAWGRGVRGAGGGGSRSRKDTFHGCVGCEQACSMGGGEWLRPPPRVSRNTP